MVRIATLVLFCLMSGLAALSPGPSAVAAPEASWQELMDRAEVLIAPDGALSLISFGGLKGETGEYLTENYPIHNLASGRDLIRLKNKVEPAQGLFALGDPDYGAMAADRIAALDDPALKSPGDSVIQVAFLTRNVRSGCGELGEMEVTPLPGTRREVELVSETWELNTSEPMATS